MCTCVKVNNRESVFSIITLYEMSQNIIRIVKYMYIEFDFGTMLYFSQNKK